MAFVKRLMFHVVVKTLIVIFSIKYIFFFLLNILFGKNKSKTTRDKSKKPSCLTDPKYGTHGTLSLKNYHDFDIHYVANGSKEKPLMLFLHGFPEFWYIWKYQLPEFAKDYYAVAIDMIGYGDSSIPKELEFYSTKELAVSVKEVIKELGYNSCVLVAHDWGGGVGYTLVNNYPEVVDKFVVMNCPHSRAIRKAWASGFKQLIASGYMFFFQLPWIPEFFLSYNDSSSLGLLRKGCKNPSNFTDEDLDAYKYTFQQTGFTGALNYYRMALSADNPRVKWQLINTPSIIIWGTGDTALNIELAAASAKEFSNCKVEYVDGASHFVNVDEPEKCNKIMKEFLQS